MSVSSFVLLLALGAASLALWVEARFPRPGQRHYARVFCHVVAALLVVRLAVPELTEALRHSGVPVALPLAAIGIALPALTYLFLSSLWLLKLAQGLVTRT